MVIFEDTAAVAVFIQGTFRVNICREPYLGGKENCDTLGLAELGTMCDRSTLRFKGGGRKYIRRRGLKSKNRR